MKMEMPSDAELVEIGRREVVRRLRIQATKNGQTICIDDLLTPEQQAEMNAERKRRRIETNERHWRRKLGIEVEPAAAKN